MMSRVRPAYGTPVTQPIILVEDDDDKLTRSIGWIAAIMTTLLLHGGLFYYATRDRSDVELPSIYEPAAVMIDMSPVVEQAYSQTDEAVGKPMQEAAAPPPPPPDIPKPEPMPDLETSPSEAVAPLPPKPPEQPKVEEKPPEKVPPKVEKKPPPEKVPPKSKKPTKRPAARSAPKTASAPRSEQRAARTAASSAGASSNPAAVADWKSQFAALINRVKRYPNGASSAGSPVVRVSISPSGAVSSASLIASSGSSDIDSEAVAAVHRVGTFPPPPSGLGVITFRMNFMRR